MSERFERAKERYKRAKEYRDASLEIVQKANGLHNKAEYDFDMAERELEAAAAEDALT